MLAALVLASLLIGLAEGIPLGRGKQWKELISMACVLGLSLFTAASSWLGIPSPLTILSQMFGPIGKLIFKVR